MNSSNVPQEGQPLPDFSLPAAVPGANGAVQETSLSLTDLNGRPFVLFVYPKDATSGCTIEVCGFRDLYEEFEKLGVEVLGVSRDGLKSHVRFIQNQNLPYPLLSDKEQTLIKGWGLLKDATMYGKPVTKVARTTFVVDGAGIVRKIYPQVTPLGHAPEVLAVVRELLS